MEGYRRADAARIIGIKRQRLYYWERIGFIRPSLKGRIKFYSFRDLIFLRAAKELLQKGVPFNKMRRAVESLRRIFPDEEPLTRVRFMVKGKNVYVVKGDIAMDPSTGQLLLELDTADLFNILKGKVERLTEKESKGWQYFMKAIQLEDVSMEKAIDALKKAIALKKNFYEAYMELGNIHFSMGLMEKAIEAFKKGIKSSPHRPEGYYNLGNALEEKGCLEDARRTYLRALKYDPHFADAHFNIARVYEKKGQIKRAKYHWRRYLQIDGNSVWAEIARRRLKELEEKGV